MSDRAAGASSLSSPGRKTSDYEYDLPDDQIARYPSPQRDASRLLVCRRDGRAPQHLNFHELPTLMSPGDVMVVNDSRVRAARLIGHKPTGAAAEILLLRPTEPRPSAASPDEGVAREWWDALVRPGGKLKPGRIVNIAPDLRIRIVETNDDGSRVVALESPGDVAAARARHGQIPLPPYLEREAEPSDLDRYQTVYAKEEGSVAAPTAGLHFTQPLMDRIADMGVSIVQVRLDVGVGTFRPVDVEDPAEHPMHREWFEVSSEAAACINATRDSGGAVWAVGTTVVRVLETVAVSMGQVEARSGWTDLFIRPGVPIRVVDHLITNFHLPRSTLLMLVATFAGFERTLSVYREAVEAGYRFYSYGDAMVVL